MGWPHYDLALDDIVDLLLNLCFTPVSTRMRWIQPKIDMFAISDNIDDVNDLDLDDDDEDCRGV